MRNRICRIELSEGTYLPPPSNPFDFSDYGSGGSGGVREPQQAADGRLANSDDPLGLGGPPDLTAPSGLRPDLGGSGASSSFDIGFGHAPAYQPDAGTASGPPVVWCVMALVAALVGIALAIVGWNEGLIATIGWVATGPVAIGFLARHTIVDTSRSTNIFYSRPAWSGPSYYGTLVCAMAGVALCAWPIAQWVARA
ncbi:hypothetical protein [Williamsia sp. M5A3_1d]